MATITLSSIVNDRAQRDGRRWIVEQHVDNAGVAHLREYLAEALADVGAALAAYAARLALALAQDEIEANVASVVLVGSLASPTFIYSSVADNLAALREAYRNATDRQAVMIGDYLSTLSDAQLRNIFSMSAAQVTSLRSNKLTPAATIASQLRAAAGQ